MVTTDSPASDAPSRPAWSIGRVVRSTEQWLQGFGLPQMERPAGMGKEYSFPTDLGQLSSVQLGTMQLRLTAWYTYTLSIIGKEEAEVGAYESVYDIRLGLAMDAEAKQHDKRILKEVLQALAIHHDEELNALHKSLIERRHRLKRIQVQADIYHEQVLRLSREQSRREAEAGVAR